MFNIFQPADENEIKRRQDEMIRMITSEIIKIANQLTTRPDCTKHDDGSYSFKNSINLNNMNLYIFPIKFKRVEGNFNCFNNYLTNLEGAPEYVGGDFGCSFNHLTSLKGAPEIVKGGFDCAYNRLTSLKGAPKKINGFFDCSNNFLTDLEYLPEYGRTAPLDIFENYIDFSGNNIKLSAKEIKNILKKKNYRFSKYVIRKMFYQIMNSICDI